MYGCNYADGLWYTSMVGVYFNVNFWYVFVTPAVKLAVIVLANICGFGGLATGSGKWVANICYYEY